MTEVAVYRNVEDEVAALKQEVAALRQTQVRYNAAPLLLCVIDGDGYIFNAKLLMLGTEGGRQAASKLRQHIITHYGSSQDLLVNVFFNREGLSKTIKAHLGVLPETFNAFILGFNTASPLMSMLDVGTGKEAADAKIREIMRIFVRYPHVKKVYFGGGHDNGYVPDLMTIQNEGYLNKIVLLQSYTQPAAGIGALGLPYLENDDIFLAEKLPRKHPTTGSPNPGIAAPTPEPEPGGERDRAVKEAPPLPPSPVKVLDGDTAEQNIAALKVIPRLSQPIRPY
ncbi:hypothetical protein FRC06_009864 [Ceratobasidium sp. 370]|nr:hypothetical protein FRC06_009864 [Ceratobasidium sp. 370]